jgi:hypothetical protein
MLYVVKTYMLKSVRVLKLKINSILQVTFSFKDLGCNANTPFLGKRYSSGKKEDL